MSGRERRERNRGISSKREGRESVIKEVEGEREGEGERGKERGRR